MPFNPAQAAQELLKLQTKEEQDRYLTKLALTAQQENQLLMWLNVAKDSLGLGRNNVPEDPASFAEIYSAKFGGSEGPKEKWKRARHLDKINEVLVDMAAGKKRRVILALPVRHGKSEFGTYWHTLWRLARNPSSKIGIFGYSHKFIERRAGRPLRDFIRDHGSEFGVELDPTSTAASSWKTAQGGYVHTAGRGGSAAGLSFDICIIDDPYKNYEEAVSDTIREATWNWWTTAIWSRKQPHTSFLLIQTLWHVDDLASRLIRQSETKEGPEWEVIKLPAIAEENDVLGREVGEPLWPEGIPIEELLLSKNGMPPHQWSALFQQNPIPAEGGMFPMSWWQYYDVLPDHFDIMIQSWDFSFKETKKSDFVVGQVWGRKGASFYLVDQIRQRMSAKDSIEAIKAFTAKYPRARAKLFEDKANGPALKALLQHEVPGIIPIQVHASKESRAAAVSPFVQAGNVYLPRPANAPWVNDFLLETGAFPNGSHDDMCFVAGTKIATPKGDKNIEDIKVGDEVLVPGGISKVIAAGATRDSVVISNCGLVGTAGHKVWQAEQLKPLSQASLSLCDRLSLWNQIHWAHLKVLNSLERSTVSWEGRDDIILAKQERQKTEKELKGCTLQSGSISLRRKFQKAMLYTTRMVTHSITAIATWSAYRFNNILQSIENKGLQLQTRIGRNNIWRKLESLLKSGTEAWKEENGIGSMLYLLLENLRTTAVSNVVEYSKQKEKLSFVLQCVDTSIKQRQDGTNENLSAKFANKLISLPPMLHLRREEQPVAESVEDFLEVNARQKVFNLKTEAGVYYANGILVSNCDSMSMALNYLAPGHFRLDRAHDSALEMNVDGPNPVEAFRKLTNKALQDQIAKKFKKPVKRAGHW